MGAFKSASASLGLLVALSHFPRAVMAQDITQPPIVFNWGSSADKTMNIHSCNEVVFSNYPLENQGSLPDPEPPYSLLVYPIEGAPEVIPAGDSGNFNWTANYDEGTQLLLGMVDSKGNGGGIGLAYTVTSGSSSCLDSAPANPVGSLTTSITSGSNPPQCDPISLSWKGGQAPYTLTVVRPGSGPFNITGITDTSYKWTNNIQNGGQAMLVVSDSTGAFFNTTSLWLSGVSDDSACLAGTTTGTTGDSGDGRSGAAIGGGIGAGVVVVLLGVLLLWWFLRKRRQQEATGGSFSEKPGVGGFSPTDSQRTSRPLRASDDRFGGMATATSDSFHGDAGVVPMSARSVNFPRASMASASPHSAHFPHHASARTSLAGGVPAGYPPPPPLPTAASAGGFRITNPDHEDDGQGGQQPQASGSAGPRQQVRRASLGPGSAYNQDYSSKNAQQPPPDLPGASRYFQANDVDDSEPNFNDELPPVYRDRRKSNT